MLYHGAPFPERDAGGISRGPAEYDVAQPDGPEQRRLCHPDGHLCGHDPGDGEGTGGQPVH